MNKTLIHILNESIKKYPDRPALTMRMGFRTHNFTYKQTYDLSKKLAVFLDKQGLKKSDHLVICAPNSPYWIIVFWACMLRGIIIVPVNIQSTEKIIKGIIDQTKPKFMFKHVFFKHKFDDNIKEYTIDYLEELLNGIDVSEFKQEEIAEDNLVQVMYTSGTTGAPKGVMLTHKNLFSNLQAIYEVIPVSAKKDRVLSILPLSHIYEQTIGFLLAYWHGVQIIYTHSPGAIRELMCEYRITKMLAVPEFLHVFMSRIEMQAEQANKKEKLEKLIKFGIKLNNKFISRHVLFRSILKKLGGKLDTIASGGAPLDPQLEQKCDAIGIYILQGYGLTETSPVVTTNTYDERKLGSVGKSIKNVEVRIADGNEIQVKGPNVFVGYYKNEEKTKESFTSDNWFKTGDLGEFDEDGFLFIKGRKKYMILGPGGQNVYPEDIESELNKHAAVKDSCVLGIKKNGIEVIHAVILLESEKEIDPEEIIKEVNSHLASYQRINEWSVWEDLDFPRTVTRKIRKEDVRKVIEGKEKQEIAKEEKGKLVLILSQLTGIDAAKINENTKIVRDLNLDSLMRIELVTRIQDVYNVVIDESKITPEITVAELERIIREQGPALEKERLKHWPRSWWATILRIISQEITALLMRIFVSLKVEGEENLKDLPTPAIFMPNHLSYLDGLVVGMALPRRMRWKISFAAARDVLYEQFKHVAWLAELLFNSFPMQRREQENIRLGLEFMGRMLDMGYNVIFFPEGRISKIGELQDLRRGTGLVAVEMDEYVIPIKITGTAEILPYDKIMPRRRGKVIVKFGKPIKFKRSESYNIAQEEIYKAMKEM